MDSTISLTVIAGLLFINTIFLVMVLIRAFKAFGEAQKLLEMIKLQLSPVIHDVTQIISDIRSIVRSAEKQMVKVEDGLTAVRDTARNLKDFETLIQERIERPLLDLTAVIAALIKGGKVFWQNFLKR